MLALEVLGITLLIIVLLSLGAAGVVWITVGKKCLPWVRRDLFRRQIAIDVRDRLEAERAAAEALRQQALLEIEGGPAGRKARSIVERSIIEQISGGEEPPESRHVGHR